MQTTGKILQPQTYISQIISINPQTILAAKIFGSAVFDFFCTCQ